MLKIGDIVEGVINPITSGQDKKVVEGRIIEINKFNSFPVVVRQDITGAIFCFKSKEITKAAKK